MVPPPVEIFFSKENFSFEKKSKISSKKNLDFFEKNFHLEKKNVEKKISMSNQNLPKIPKIALRKPSDEPKHAKTSTLRVLVPEMSRLRGISLVKPFLAF